MRIATKDDPVVRQLDRLIVDFHRREQARELALIEEDPDAHALTKIMAGGKPTSYRYFRSKRRGVRFCYLVHRNAAGYFLTWREVTRKDGSGHRDEFSAWKSKKSAIAAARARARR